MAHRSSTTGGNEAYVSSIAVNVPAGAASGDIVVVGLARWEATNPAVTLPSGFAAVGAQSVNGSGKLDIYQKRLTGADAGTYSFSWTGTMWTSIMASAFSGRLAAGDAIAANVAAATGSGTTFTTISVTPAYADPDLAYFVYTDAGGTHTPPTNFIERSDSDASTHATRDGTGLGVGTFSAASGTGPSSSWIARLVAIEPAAGGGVVTAIPGRPQLYAPRRRAANW